MFGGPMRMGDLVALCNAITFLRDEIPGLKFCLHKDALSWEEHVSKFYSYLLNTTDFFEYYPLDNDNDWKWNKVNLWDLRCAIGDKISIQNNRIMENKLVIFPLWDAPYNKYRNWPSHLLPSIVQNNPNNSSYDKKIICVTEEAKKYIYLNYQFSEDWEISTDFMENINHVETCTTYIGADTGFSHFASALDKGPKNLLYFYSGRGLLHTTPFYLLKGKGVMHQYWLDFEGTTWN